MNPSLTIKTPILADNRQIRGYGDVNSLALQTWERSIRLQGGPWIGRFRVPIGGDDGITRSQAKEIFYNWLGYDVVERAGGITWNGMVYEVTMSDGITRHRSLETVKNRVYATYRYLQFNGGFETVGSGGNAFDSWTDTIGGSDTIAMETDGTLVAGGTASARLINAGNGQTFTQQAVTVKANAQYRVSFYARGDGTNEGRYRIRDNSGDFDIVGLSDTGNSGTAFRRIVEDVTTPNGCTSLLVRFRVPSAAGTAWFDDCTIQRIIDDRPGEEITEAAENTSSQNRYGKKDALLKGFANPTDAVAARDTHLARNIYPELTRSPVMMVDRPYMEVMCCGYIFTTKWLIADTNLYRSETDAATLTSTLLNECEFFNNILTATNAMVVDLGERFQTVRDALNTIVAAGDTSGNVWRLYIDGERNAIYEQLPTTPLYHLRGNQFYHAGGGRTAINGWQMRPGVVRDLSYPVSNADSDHWFDDQRDFILEEVVMGPNGLSWGELQL